MQPLTSPVGRNEVVINDANAHLYVPGGAAVRGKSFGLRPRPAALRGTHAFAPPFSLPVITDPKEQQERLTEQVAKKAQLSNVRDTAGPNGGRIPSRDQDGKGYCVLPGTPVLMAGGAEKPIDSVRVGEMVVVAEDGGERDLCRPVRQLHGRQYDGPVVSLFGGRLKMTPNHAVYTVNRGKVPSGELTGEDQVAVRFDGEDAVRKVGAVGVERYAGPVHNLGVADYHSYIAARVPVANCWAHSSVSAMLLARAAMGEPYADLSAFAVACVIKGYRDEGGWGSESLEFIASRGVPTSQFWPQQSMSRSNDKPETWANAGLHKYVQWQELAADPQTRKNQLITCYLLGIPTVNDYNRWSHSVAGSDVVSITPFSHRIWNSWGESYGQNGMGVLEGDSWLPDDAWAAVVATPSAG